MTTTRSAVDRFGEVGSGEEALGERVTGQVTRVSMLPVDPLGHLLLPRPEDGGTSTGSQGCGGGPP